MKKERRAESLGEWVDVATRGLCDYAKDRIGIEVHGHFAEAFDEVRGKGMSEAEATRAAVMSLGDPVEARRQFKRTHLTRIESAMLGFLTDRRYGRFPLGQFLKFVVLGFGVPVSVVGSVVFAMRGEFSRVGMLLGAMALLVILIYGLSWCLDAFGVRLRERFGTTAGIPNLFWLIFVQLPWIDGHPVALVMWALFVFFFVLPFVSLWRKAARVRAASDR